MKSNAQTLRLQAISRVLEGEAPTAVARDIGYHVSSIYSWLNAYRKEGEPGLASKHISGRPAKLSSGDKSSLKKRLLRQTPQQCGFSDYLWNTELVAALLKQQFGVSLKKTATNQLLADFGLNIGAAKQGIPDNWLTQKYPELQRLAKKQGAAIFFYKVSGKDYDSIDGENKPVNALSATSPLGTRYFLLSSRAPGATQFIDFIEKLLIQNNDRKLFLLMPETPLQSMKKVRDFLELRQQQLTVFSIPASKSVYDNSAIARANSRARARQMETDMDSMGEQPAAQTPASANGLSTEDINQVIPLIYKTVLESHNPWVSLIDRLSERIPCDDVHIVVNTRAPGSFIGRYWNANNYISRIENFRSAWPANPFLHTRLAPGKVARLSDVLPDKELVKNNFYKNIMQPAEMKYCLVMCFSGPHDLDCLLLLYNKANRRDFSAADKQFVLALLPHLEMAVDIYIRIRNGEVTMDNLKGDANRAGFATFVLDGNGNVIQTNNEANHLLAQSSLFHLSNKRLHIHNRNDHARLKRAVERSIAWRLTQTGDKPIEVFRIGKKNRTNIGVLVQPINLKTASFISTSPHAIIHMGNSEISQMKTNRQIVKQLFDLSPRHAHLANLLASGHSLEQAAQEMNITIKTARTYLQRIYARLGISRQTELVQLILKSVALLV